MKPTRTMQQVAAELDCSEANVRRWASRWKWRKRVSEFDVHQDELHREEMARQRTRTRERQAQLGITLQEIGMQGLAEWQRKIEKGESLNLPPDDIVRLLDVGARLEQKARGDDQDSNFTRINVIVGKHAYADEKETTPDSEPKTMN